jgi:hypothetical protein
MRYEVKHRDSTEHYSYSPDNHVAGRRRSAYGPLSLSLGCLPVERRLAGVKGPGKVVRRTREFLEQFPKDGAAMSEESLWLGNESQSTVDRQMSKILKDKKSPSPVGLPAIRLLDLLVVPEFRPIQHSLWKISHWC